MYTPPLDRMGSLVRTFLACRMLVHTVYLTSAGVLSELVTGRLRS